MTKAEKTRQFIIEKSAPIFNIKGVAGTSMSDIMEATNLAKGSLYVHFENKEELSYAVVDYNLSLLAEKVLGAVHKQVTAKAKLFAYTDYLSDPMNPPIEGGCPMINFGMEADDNNPAIKQKVHNLVDGTQTRIAAIIEQGKKDGEFITSWNSDEFATKMFAMIEGGIMICRVAGNSDKMKIINTLVKKEIEDHTV